MLTTIRITRPEEETLDHLVRMYPGGSVEMHILHSSQPITIRSFLIREFGVRYISLDDRSDEHLDDIFYHSSSHIDHSHLEAPV